MNDICRNICPCSECSTDEEDCELALAYQMRVPMKPTEIDYDSNYFVCSSCGESIYASENLETHKFCLECGQAIDWSSEDGCN